MIGRNHFVELKRIEKLPLSFFPPPHHAPLPLMPPSPTESWFAIRIKGSFATQSEQKLTSFARGEFSPFDPSETSSLIDIRAGSGAISRSPPVAKC
jgi:hypothetical protein